MSTLEESTTTTTENERRARWIASLRDVADFYEQHPDFPIHLGGQRFFAFVGYDADVRSRFAEMASMLGGQRTKDANDNWFRVVRKFGPFEIEVYAERDAVCTKVVVGTETVKVPDPAAPKITVEREVIEWHCEPSVLGASA